MSGASGQEPAWIEQLQFEGIDRGAVTTFQGMAGKPDTESSPFLKHRHFINHLAEGDVFTIVAVNGLQAGWPAGDLIGLREDVEGKACLHMSVGGHIHG